MVWGMDQRNANIVEWWEKDNIIWSGDTVKAGDPAGDPE